MSFQASFILNIVHFCEKQGVEGKYLLARSGIDTATLGEPISLDKVDSLWKNAIELTGDNFLGLHIGEDSNLSALGVVGQLIQNSQNVEEALQQACKFIGLLTDAFEMKYSRQSNASLISIIPGDCREQYPDSMRQIIDSTLVFTLKEYQALVMEKLFPQQILLDYPETEETEEYERIFKCPIVFNSSQTALQIDSKYLNQSIPAANNQLFAVMQKFASELLMEQQNTRSIVSLVKEALIRQGNFEFPQLQDVASLYNMSERTLQRELQQEGTNFQQLLDEVRKDYAIRYLKNEKVAIEEISYILGYNNPSAFTRSFKRWMGKSPRDYKRSISR